jgi:transcriptional regulator with XRE-family HTH domain
MSTNSKDKLDALGPRLSSLLAELDMTQTAFAEILGCRQSTISQWLTSKREPSLSDLCRIADLFDTTTDYLLDRTSTRYHKAMS